MATLPLNKLDLRSREIRDDPWTTFSQLRRQGPVIRFKMPLIGTGWAATSYDAVSEVFKNSEHFVRNPKNAGRKTYAKVQWLMPRVFDSLVQNMLGADGQRHRRLRSLVDQAFTRRNIDGMSKQIESLAQQQLDIAAAVARREGQVDLLEHFARPFPLTVICELLGLPLEDRPKFQEWFAPFSKVSSVFGIFSLSWGLRKIIKYLRFQIKEVSQHPRPGLMTELVQAEHEGQQLTEDELLAMIFLLLVAGHETTVHLISNAVLALLDHPEAKNELLADWSKSDDAIEEVLRYCSPLQMGKPRFVANDLNFFGQQLQRGEMITPLIACANYDPDRFEDPLRFNIDRERNYHLSFGSGPHVCLGMKLARTETHFALKCLFERWPNFKPTFDLKHPDWSQRLGIRGLKTMSIKTS